MLAKLRRVLVLFALATLCSLPLYAHQVALKNGFVIHFQKYRVADNKLYYVGDSGKEVAVPLSTINMELTQQLNTAEKTPLKLPGMSATQETNGDGQPASLGELAQRLRSKDAKTTNQRVFTNDDFHYTSDPEQNISKSSPDWSAALEQMKESLRTRSGMTEQQFALEALPNDLQDIQFPGRGRWEDELYAAQEGYL